MFKRERLKKIIYLYWILHEKKTGWPLSNCTEWSKKWKINIKFPHYDTPLCLWHIKSTFIFKICYCPESCILDLKNVGEKLHILFRIWWSRSSSVIWLKTSTFFDILNNLSCLASAPVIKKDLNFLCFKTLFFAYLFI